MARPCACFGTRTGGQQSAVSGQPGQSHASLSGRRPGCSRSGEGRLGHHRAIIKLKAGGLWLMARPCACFGRSLGRSGQRSNRPRTYVAWEQSRFNLTDALRWGRAHPRRHERSCTIEHPAAWPVGPPAGRGRAVKLEPGCSRPTYVRRGLLRPPRASVYATTGARPRASAGRRMVSNETPTP